MEIPENILALARLVQTQSHEDHITSHPVYQVRRRVRVYGLDFHDEDGAIWIDTRISEPADQSTTNLMEARYRKDRTTETDNFLRCPYREVESVIQSFFTEEYANRFMKRQAHNYSGMYLYVESGYDNPEWRQIEAFLLSTPAEEAKTCAINTLVKEYGQQDFGEPLMQELLAKLNLILYPQQP